MSESMDTARPRSRPASASVEGVPTGNRLVSLDFHATTSGRAPMTWGQAAIWQPIQWYSDDSAYFNMARVVRPPDGADLAATLEALRGLVAAQQVLRSRYGNGPRGPFQDVYADGVLSLSVVETTYDDADATADALAADLSAKSFQHDEEWPVLIAIGTCGDTCLFVVFVLSHLAVDWWGLEVLTSDFLARLAGPVDDPMWQPLDQAGYEQSAACLRRGETALEHWRRTLSTLPPSMFDYPAVTPEQPRFHRLCLSSPALAAAADLLATANRVSTSSVLLAGVALTLSALSGRQDCLLQLIVSNRHDERRAGLAAATVQNGLFALDRRAADVAGIIRICYRSGLAAYAHGHYDPAALGRLTADLAVTQGVRFDLNAYYNDARGGVDRWPDVDTEGMTEEALAALRDMTVVSHDSAWETQDCKFFFAVEQAPDRALCYLLADTAYLPVSRVEQVLRGIETILVEAAFRPVMVAEVAELTGLREPDRSGWWPVRSGWVDPAAVRAVVATASGARDVAVFPDENGLLALLAAPQDIGDLPALHRAVVDQLADRTDAVAPDRYVVCAAPPEDVTDLGAWQAIPVVRTGSGRSGQCSSTKDAGGA